MYLDFLKDIKHLSCEDFAKLFLKQKFSANYVVVGEDFRFGINQSGDINTLKTLGDKFGFSVLAVTMSKVRKNQISRSGLRRLKAKVLVMLA